MSRLNLSFPIELYLYISYHKAKLHDISSRILNTYFLVESCLFREQLQNTVCHGAF